MTYKATFLLGVPDDRMVKFNRLDKEGNLIFNMEGNAEFHNFLPIPQQNKRNVFITWFAEPVLNLPKCNIIINNITDPDTNRKSLEIAARIVKFVKRSRPDIAIFNDPEKVFNTTREKIYTQYSGLKGIYIPKVVRVKPESADDVIEKANIANLKYPFLIRPCGMHESKKLQLIKSKADNKLLEQYAYDGTEYYITEFVDYKSEDGQYRKARLLVIGGRICPRHYMVGEGWMVHGNLHSEYMASRLEAKKAEVNFINNFRNIISAEALESIRQIYKRSGLDYLGFDFAIRPDGSLIVFEINPAQNPFIALNPKDFPYMQAVRNNIIKTLGATAKNKVKSFENKIKATTGNLANRSQKSN